MKPCAGVVPRSSGLPQGPAAASRSRQPSWPPSSRCGAGGSERWGGWHYYSGCCRCCSPAAPRCWVLLTHTQIKRPWMLRARSSWGSLDFDLGCNDSRKKRKANPHWSLALFVLLFLHLKAAVSAAWCTPGAHVTQLCPVLLIGPVTPPLPTHIPALFLFTARLPESLQYWWLTHLHEFFLNC